MEKPVFAVTVINAWGDPIGETLQTLPGDYDSGSGIIAFGHNIDMPVGIEKIPDGTPPPAPTPPILFVHYFSRLIALLMGLMVLFIMPGSVVDTFQLQSWGHWVHTSIVDSVILTVQEQCDCQDDCSVLNLQILDNCPR